MNSITIKSLTSTFSLFTIDLHKHTPTLHLDSSFHATRTTRVSYTGYIPCSSHL